MPQLQGGRPEAAAVIWDWRGAAAPEPAPEESPGRNRLLGTVQGLVAGTLGLLVYNFWSTTIGTVIFCIAGIVLFSALVSPTGLYLGVQGVFRTLGRWTGIALTWILMVPVFYLFFLPFGALLRRGRRDRLKRYFERDAESYWEPHEGPTAASDSFERQY